LIHSKTIWDAAISPVTMKWKKWCMCDLSFNQKDSFLWAYRSSWTAGLRAIKNGDCTEKWCYCTRMLIVLFNKKLIADALWLILVIILTTHVGAVRSTSAALCFGPLVCIN
jgi:hypothetical protein